MRIIRWQCPKVESALYNFFERDKYEPSQYLWSLCVTDPTGCLITSRPPTLNQSPPFKKSMILKMMQSCHMTSISNMYLAISGLSRISHPTRVVCRINALFALSGRDNLEQKEAFRTSYGSYVCRLIWHWFLGERTLGNGVSLHQLVPSFPQFQLFN